METTYINKGLVYKVGVTSNVEIEGKSIVNVMFSDGGVESVYYTSANVSAEEALEIDKLIPLKSRKTDLNNIVSEKTYKSTSQFRELIGVKGGLDINSLSVSLCPDVSVWGGIGEITGKTQDEFIELYFNVTSSENMQDVADFYNLTTPLATDNDLNTDRSNWTLREYSNGIDLVLGSIVFESNTPSLLKIYKYEKEENGEV